MLVFGLLSLVFDYLTFAALLLLLHANSAQFRTGWFMESVISASMIVLVIRTRQSILTSKPGKYLLMATIAIVIVTLLIPYTPLAGLLGFQPLPIEFFLVLAAIVGLKGRQLMMIYIDLERNKNEINLSFHWGNIHTRNASLDVDY